MVGLGNMPSVVQVPGATEVVGMRVVVVGAVVIVVGHEFKTHNLVLGLKQELGGQVYLYVYHCPLI